MGGEKNRGEISDSGEQFNLIQAKTPTIDVV